MTAFYKEARRLWDLEAGTNSLTRIHAGICLCMFNHLSTALYTALAYRNMLNQDATTSYPLSLLGLYASTSAPILQLTDNPLRSLSRKDWPR
jgi:hypothetical protein